MSENNIPVLAEDAELTTPAKEFIPPRKRSKGRFWKGVSIYAAALLSVGAVALVLLYGYLANFENGTPNAALEDYLAWARKGNYEAICDASGFEETALNTREEYIAYFEELFDGNTDDLILREKLSLDGTKKFSLYNGELKLANLRVAPNTEGNGDTWYVSTELNYQKPYTLIVSEELRLTVNGADIATLELPCEEIQSTLFPTQEDSAFRPPVVRKYTLEGLLNPPTVSALALSGEQCPVVIDGQDITVQNPGAAAVKAENEKLATEAAFTYAKYVAKDATRTQLLSYIHPESTLYDTIRNFSNAWFYKHDSYEFRDVTVTQYTSYSSSDFSCAVSFCPVYMREGKVIESIPVHYRLSFVLDNGTWMLYSLTQTTAEQSGVTTTNTNTTTATVTTTTNP